MYVVGLVVKHRSTCYFTLKLTKEELQGQLNRNGLETHKTVS